MSARHTPDLTVAHVAAMGGVAPRIWWYEIRNALLMSERRNRISREQATDAIAQSRKLYVGIDDSHDEFSLAGLTRRFNLTIYDAAYLEVALRRGLPLATLDKRLRAAAREVGVALHDEAGADSSGAP